MASGQKADATAGAPSREDKRERGGQEDWERRGYSSVVEPQPSKLLARVRFSLPAPLPPKEHSQGESQESGTGCPPRQVQQASVLATSVLSVEIDR